MKKILIFNGYYIPSKNCGGPITSIENVVNALYKEFEFFIVCYNHDFNDCRPFDLPTNDWIRIGHANVMYVNNGYFDFSLSKTKSLYDSLKPDLIWFSGVLTPNNKIVTLLNAGKMGIPVLFSPRGEVSSDRVCIKGYKKIPYLKFINFTGIFKRAYFHATSDDEIIGLRRFFNPREDHLFKVANISVLEQEKVVEYRKSDKLLKVLFFSRIHEVKNVLYAIQCITKCKNNIKFDIYGPIESIDYWEKCKEEISKAPANIEIKYCGIINHSIMSKTIQKYDCFFFPTVNENYGHVIAETLANSRPVILSKGTTPWDDIDGKAGYIADLKKPEKFTEIIDNLARKTSNDFSELIVSTQEYFRSKVAEDSAVVGHKEMFYKIINS